MVKKIRMVEDEVSGNLENDEYQAKMLEYQQAIDWKLWEMMKILQAWAEKEGLTEKPEETKKPAAKKPARKKATVKSVIVDEDE